MGRPDSDLAGLVAGYRQSQLLRAIAELDIPRHIAPSPVPVEVLASLTGTDFRLLARLCRALVADGMLDTSQDGAIVDTPIAARLRDPGYRAMVLGWTLLPAAYEQWGRLSDIVRGAPRAADTFHATLEHDPAQLAAYSAAMESTIDGFNAVVAGHDFGRYRTIVDVGGGEGTFLAAVLRANPSAHGILLDLPAVVAGAPARLAGYGVADRVDIVGGDAFDSMPAGADAYVLSTVLRCFDDPDASRLLQRCRQAMSPASRVVIVEMVIPDDNVSAGSAIADLTALVVYGGGDRTEDEWAVLLESAGLRIDASTEVDPPYRVIEAVAAA
ncbi:MAG TPA: methyltransferase [Candidatus Dormibacteraeota bacterium]|nr:methyltransferase [Candidatus Dormibacteraeota bacterium]